MLRRRNAFTLIELMVVIIIVAILASVAVPMMSGHIKKARKAEAVTAMGIIYAAERKYYAEWDGYRSSTTGGGTAFFSAIGMAPQDLDGAYFSNQCYGVAAEGENLSINCDPNSSTALKNAEVSGEPVIVMNRDGVITEGY